jgi:hypothetical protein
VKKIEVIRIEKSAKKFTKQLRKFSDYSIIVKLSDVEIETAVKNLMEEKLKDSADTDNTSNSNENLMETREIITAENLTDTNTGSAAIDSKKSTETLPEVNNQNSTETIDTNIGTEAMENFIREIKEITDMDEVDKSVKNFAKTLIEFKQISEITENEDIRTKFEGLMVNNNTFKELVNGFIGEIEKVRESVINIIEKINDKELDNMEEAVIEASAKKFIKRKMKIRIEELKKNFITAIKATEDIETSLIKKSMSKFIEVIEVIHVIADIAEVESSVNKFIDQYPIKAKLETGGTDPIDVAKIEKSVKDFING